MGMKDRSMLPASTMLFIASLMLMPGCGVDDSPSEEVLTTPPTPLGHTFDEAGSVAVTLDGYWKEDDMFDDDEFEWSGSGIVFGEYGGNLHILTNFHCLALQELFESDEWGNPHVLDYRIKVTFHSGASRAVRSLRLPMDEDLDLAFLSVSAAGLEQGEDFVVAIPFTGTSAVGDEVVAVGSPLSFECTYTWGRLSAFRLVHGFEYIQTDAAINSGNSGGPLFIQRDGVLRVIAVNTSTIRPELGHGLGFSISIEEAVDENFSDWIDLSEIRAIE